MKKRIDWIDTAKFWGLLFVYLGHFGDAAGYAYHWVFIFHVPFLFFLSGCVESLNNRGFLANLRNKAAHVLLPFYLFGLLEIVYTVIKYNSIADVLISLQILLQGGIRNSFIRSVDLWFLSCLFVIQIIFSILKTIKNRAVVLAVCLCLFIVAEYVIDPSPFYSPHWIYNVDSAFYYIIFYCLGWLAFPLINRLLEDRRSVIRILRSASTAACLIFSAILFFYIDKLTPLCERYPLFRSLYALVLPLPVIWLMVYVSYLFPGRLTARIGRNTLYLCGNEYIIKDLIALVFSMIGVPLLFPSPILIYIYSFVLLILVDRLLVPLEKPLFSKLQGLLAGRAPKEEKQESLGDIG